MGRSLICRFKGRDSRLRNDMCKCTVVAANLICLKYTKRVGIIGAEGARWRIMGR
jgi:hypothetical protein